MLWDGAVEALISELRNLRHGPRKRTEGDEIQLDTNCFNHNRRRMDNSPYRT